MRLKIACAALAAVLLLSGCAGGEVIHSHDYRKEQVELTCTQDSGIRYVCSCGHSYMKVDKKAAGHSYEAQEVGQKDDMPAYTQYTCSVCGDTYQDSFQGGVPGATESTAPAATEPEGTEPEGTQPAETTGETQAPTDGDSTAGFFDDAAFIGDSVSVKLENYHTKHNVFGSATFLTAVSYSVYHAVNDTMLLSYKGQWMTPEEAVAACGAKKVFILLGINDIARSGVGIDKTITNWAVFIQRLREKNPDIAIYIQACTPVHASCNGGPLGNANIDDYNGKLKTFAEQNNCQFVDIATPMKDEEGNLKAAFCHDQYVHLTDKACEAWIGALEALAEK